MKGSVNVLVVDVGGTRVKILATGQKQSREFPSGPKLSAKQIVTGVKKLAKDWRYDAVSIGYPGPVIRNRPLAEPYNLGPGWVGFDFEGAFNRPVKVINDAAMQALGSYKHGKMLFLGLGTGLGSAMVVDGIVEPMELGHLPYRRRTFEDYVGVVGRARLGQKKWERAVKDVIARLIAALQPEDVVLGGGNVKNLEKLPPGCRAGENANAFVGGFRVWEKTRRRHRSTSRRSHSQSQKGAVSLPFVWAAVRETKGKTLEQMKETTNLDRYLATKKRMQD
jgi:polyphosphate glucokinase